MTVCINIVLYDVLKGSCIVSPDSGAWCIMCICSAFLSVRAYMIRFAIYHAAGPAAIPDPCRSIYARLVRPSFPRSLPALCSFMLSGSLAGNNLCPVSGALKGGRKMKSYLSPLLFYHTFETFLSAESPHFSTFCGVCRKKFEKKLKKGVDSLPDGML